MKLDVNDIISNDFNLDLLKNEEDYYIAEQNSQLLDQIEKIRGYKTNKVTELICVLARHNKKKWDDYRRLFKDGFLYGGNRYVRLGKSSSQSKDGITVFVMQSIYKEILKRSMLDIDVFEKEVVISKYESQRCLIFSNCDILKSELPRTVIVGEYEKILPKQDIKYAKEVQKNGYTYRQITDGEIDVKISPFDGFGVHSVEYGSILEKELDIGYKPCAVQVRLPFTKGMSIEFDFHRYFKERGIFTIRDVLGKEHRVEDIDCIWNTTMFKAFGLFKEEFGESAIDEYFNVLKKYDYKIGISKYSHNISGRNIMARMNFQYLQCLDLYNDKYISHFDDLKKSNNKRYNILDSKNDGKIISLAKYSTNMFEKIAAGSKFHMLKFLGVSDSESEDISSKYIKAVLINEDMMNDPSIKKYVIRKAQKYINQMKVGKIYSNGFYHVISGDIIGYLEFVSGKDPVGVLNSGEFFAKTIFKDENIVSFRSPLVCQSEVNKVFIKSEIIGYEDYFSHFIGQDFAMINMYDLTMPQQSGCDCDGDILFLTNNPIIVESKINKKIVVGIDDKATAQKIKYCDDSIIDYELRSRDSRIGEITNIATSILNKYTTDKKYQDMNNDNISFLRLLQGVEIDSIKTGIRWNIPSYLRNYLKQIPYFLMYNYPKKMNTYIRTKKYNKGKDYKDKKPSNAYHSCSPMNELCEYICRWENERLRWNKTTINTGVLLVDNNINYSNQGLIRELSRINTEFAKEWKSSIYLKDRGGDINYDLVINKYKDMIMELSEDLTTIANYFIFMVYKSVNTNKVLCWSVFGDYMLKNLEKNSPPKKSIKIDECEKNDKDAIEYLGKYYRMEEF